MNRRLQRRGRVRVARMFAQVTSSGETEGGERLGARVIISQLYRYDVVPVSYRRDMRRVRATGRT